MNYLETQFWGRVFEAAVKAGKTAASAKGIANAAVRYAREAVMFGVD